MRKALVYLYSLSLSNKWFFGVLFSPGLVFSGVGKACLNVFLEELKAKIYFESEDTKHLPETECFAFAFSFHIAHDGLLLSCMALFICCILQVTEYQVLGLDASEISRGFYRRSSRWPQGCSCAFLEKPKLDVD